MKRWRPLCPAPRAPAAPPASPAPLLTRRTRPMASPRRRTCSATPSAPTSRATWCALLYPQGAPCCPPSSLHACQACERYQAWSCLPPGSVQRSAAFSCDLFSLSGTVRGVGAQAPTRLPCTPAHKKRPRHHRAPPGQGPAQGHGIAATFAPVTAYAAAVAAGELVGGVWVGLAQGHGPAALPHWTADLAAWAVARPDAWAGMWIAPRRCRCA